jgi:hypothetical protein
MTANATVGIDAIPTKNPARDLVVGSRCRKVLDIPKWHQVATPPEVAEASKRVYAAVEAVKAAGNEWDDLIRQSQHGLRPEVYAAAADALNDGTATPVVEAVNYDTQRATLAAKIEGLVRCAEQEKASYNRVVDAAMPSWCQSMLDGLSTSLTDLETASVAFLESLGKVSAHRKALEDIREKVDPDGEPVPVMPAAQWHRALIDIDRPFRYLREWITHSRTQLAAYKPEFAREDRG